MAECQTQFHDSEMTDPIGGRTAIENCRLMERRCFVNVEVPARQQGIADRSNVSHRWHAVPRLQRTALPRQTLGAICCPLADGPSSPCCETMAKTVVSAVKPGEKAMGLPHRAFLFLHHLYKLCRQPSAAFALLSWGGTWGIAEALYIWRVCDAPAGVVAACRGRVRGLLRSLQHGCMSGERHANAIHVCWRKPMVCVAVTIELLRRFDRRSKSLTGVPVATAF